MYTCSDASTDTPVLRATATQRWQWQRQRQRCVLSVIVDMARALSHWGAVKTHALLVGASAIMCFYASVCVWMLVMSVALLQHPHILREHAPQKLSVTECRREQECFVYNRILNGGCTNVKCLELPNGWSE